MATKAKRATKKTTLKDEVIELRSENEFLKARIASFTAIIGSLQVQVEKLEEQLDKNNDTSRHWVLRKLGL